jgi:hypothetical protein
MQSDFGAPGQQSAAYTVSRLAGDAEQVGAAMQKFAIVTSGFGTARQKLALERWTHSKLSRCTCSPRYGVPSCRGKSAGVA